MGYIQGFFLLVIIGVCTFFPASAQPITAPAIITTPGAYELSADARGLTDMYGITIECSDVVIEGNGHFLGGEGRDKSIGVYVKQYGDAITNISVRNLIIEDWATGINYNYVKGQEGDINLISDCEIINTDKAIHLEYSDLITVEKNQIRESSSGIIVDQNSSGVTISQNSIKGAGLGMSISDSKESVISENNINTCTEYGLEVTDAQSTTITRNSISDNAYAALRIENSKDSRILSNTLSKTENGAVLVIGNEVRDAVISDNYFSSFKNVVVDEISTGIVWNSTQKPGTNILGGPYLGGNYWGSSTGQKGYSDTAVDSDGFGIADKPYNINEFNIDYLPLTPTTATVAPEAQIDTFVPNQSAESDLNLTEVVPESEDQVTSESPDRAEPLLTIQDSTDNETVVPQDNTSSGLNATTQIFNPSPSGGEKINSDLNQSITNGYSGLTNAVEEPSPAPVEQSVPVIATNVSETNATESGVNPEKNETTGDGSINQSSISPIGYLIFNSTVPGARVILTTSSGKEISLDPMSGMNQTIPVPIEGIVYTRYQIQKDGYASVSGNITPYPEPGRSLEIPVNLTENGNRSESTPASIQTITLPVVEPVDNSSPPADNTTQKHNSVSWNVTVSLPPLGVKNLSPVNQSGQGLDGKLLPVSITNGLSDKNNSPMTHTISASAGPGGAIFPEGKLTVQDRTTAGFVINPYEGRKISYLMIDGIQNDPVAEYKFRNVTADHTIVAGFT